MSDGDPFEAILRSVAATPSSPTDVPAAPSPRYRLAGLLGRGGGGQVYRAYDEQLGRNVALKFLIATGAAQAKQLVNEARTQARVRHPGVCQVYEVSENDEHPFIAMQLIDGPTLSDAVTAGKLSRDELLDVIRQVADAVEAAHQLGIVHRDLKPSNIMIERATDGWRAYVMDFGLAREIDKTMTSGSVGTPHFMSPEQARGDKTITRPTDIWALGATLYALLAGAPPFEAESVVAILSRVEYDDPARLSMVPRELEAIVLRCLEKSPARRYASASALARDLTAFMHGDEVSAQPPGPARRLIRRARRWRRLGVGVIAAIVVGAIAVSAAVIATRRPLPWRPIVREIMPVYDESSSGPLISPDGKTLIFDSDRNGTFALYTTSLDGGLAHMIGGTGPARLASWSSDGRAVYFTHDNELGTAHLWRAPIDESAPPVQVVAAADASECAGHLFYLATADGMDRLMERDPLGETHELLRMAIGIRNVVCSPDARRVTWANRNGKVAWMNVSDREVHWLPPLSDRMGEPSFHPSGNSLVVTVRDHGRRVLWESKLDGSKARKLTDGGRDGAGQISPDGKRLIFLIESAGRTLMSLDLATNRGRSLPFTDGWNVISPTADGREILSSHIGTTTGTVDVVALSLADGKERTLAQGWLPDISPDDKDVYYIDSGQSPHRIWTIPRAGGTPRLVGTLPEEIFWLRTAADGLHLQTGNERRHGWFLPYDGGPGHAEGPEGTTFIEPAADGWKIAIGKTEHVVLIPPSWQGGGAVLPKELKYYNAHLTRDRRSFVALDDDHEMWLVEIATGKRSHWDRVGNPAEAVLSSDGKTGFVMNVKRHAARAELMNYAELPPL